MNQTKLLFPLIFISLEDDSSIVIPPQPTSPGEIMSGGEGEPIEADAPAEDETVSPQGTHVTGTQTVTHEYLTLNGKVARETIKTNDSLTAVLDGPMVKGAHRYISYRAAAAAVGCTLVCDHSLGLK